MNDYRWLFSQALMAPHLHFAAHSHHLWPDASWQGHQQAWHDACFLADKKWDAIFSKVLPTAEQHLCRLLNVSVQDSFVFAPNTHELVVRLLSCFPPHKRLRILTTDSEFHSARRQFLRMQEAGLLELEIIATEPFNSFEERFLEKSNHSWDMVFFSQVFFNSGFALTQCQLERFVKRFSAQTEYVVIDGYHGFMARPTSLSEIQETAFYIAGGYKYAMAGEGVGLMHVPAKVNARPMNTGWYAGFADLAQSDLEQVSYPNGARQFFGATFDPSGVYRFNAVQQALCEHDISVAQIHDHVQQLQHYFLSLLNAQCPALLRGFQLLPMNETRGHFLTLKFDHAKSLYQRLLANNILVDVRQDRLRFGFGLYHVRSDIDRLWSLLSSIEL